MLSDFPKGRIECFSSGKAQFDLAECQLLETLDGVAFCRGWHGARLEKH